MGRRSHFPHDTVFKCACGSDYLIKSDHRNGGNGHKSQWTIAEADEVNCFDVSQQSGWTDDGIGWGLHLVQGAPDSIGASPNGEKLFVAKFVDGVSWHGYPSDYQRKQQDRPPITVLQLWRAAQHINKADMTRIRQGKPCNLSA